MAGASSLPNANWHMFEPSPIETQLALVDPVRNPRAVALAGGYAAERRMAQDDYATQLQWTRQQQLAEFQQKRDSEFRTQLAHMIKEAATPGAAAAMRTAGILPQSVDTAALEAGGQAAADAKNMNEVGSGIGRLAQGNVQVGQTQLQKFLPGAVQGPNAQIASAQINANSRVAAAQIGAASRAARDGNPAQPTTSITLDTPGGSIRVNSAKKGGPLTPEAAMRAIGVDPASPQGQRMMRGLQPPGGGTTQLPQAPTSNDVADAAPFAAAAAASPSARLPANSPLAGSLPSAAPPATPAQPSSQSVAGMEAMNKALRELGRRDPKAAEDILQRARTSGGKAAFVKHGDQVAVLGASGTTYPLP